MHKNSNLSMESAQPTVKFPPPSDLENKEHQLISSTVLRMDERAFKSEMYSCGQMTPLLSSSTGLGLVNRVDPLRIPDLNLSLEDDFGTDSFQPYDMSSPLIDKATAAEARKKRMQIYKVKNSIAAAKLRYGHR
ncbi:hypothetical protein L1049_026912 [Liquidambar formosana]|uniref:Uncharacterized protein n=1 Tax=Liquidambar formosana TaxID=63359 RepID=A0AAP0NDI5_LIQFO